MYEENLRNVLKKLILSAWSLADEKLSKKEIVPIGEKYFKWNVKKFEYTEKGVIASSAEGKYFIKEVWWRVADSLTEIVKSFDEYKLARKELEKVHKDSKIAESNLNMLMRRVILHRLEKQDSNESDTNNFVNIFILDINDKPLKCFVQAEINGIALESKEIELSSNITIRQVCKEDLEKEIPAEPMIYSGMDSFGFHPSVIIKIEKLENELNNLQKIIEKVITILRLFKVGSIRWSSYSFWSESILKFGGTLSTNKHQTPHERYYVKSLEDDALRKFFAIIDEHLPTRFFWHEGKIDHTTIAYQRYCEALLEGGIIEKRIANVIMGLEALFLIENQELKHKLSLRVSKFLSLLSYDPHQVKSTLSHAYDIRSLYTHGSTLDYKSLKKYQQKLGDLHDFLIKIMDYLRVCLVFSILMQQDKEEFIDLLDDSLIDKKKEETLANKVAKWKNILISPKGNEK